MERDKMSEEIPFHTRASRSLMITPSLPNYWNVFEKLDDLERYDTIRKYITALELANMLDRLLLKGRRSRRQYWDRGRY